MEFQINPRFSALRNSLYFNVGELNTFQAANYTDKFGHYQRLFGLYSYMQITKDNKFKIHYPEGTPFMWQVHRSCAWTPTGTLSMDSKEIDACKVKINEEYCYDEFFNSTYKEFLEWSNGTTVELSAVGTQASAELFRTIVKNASLGARLTLTAGQLHDISDGSDQEINEGTPTRIADAFTRTHTACRGWLALVRAMSTQPGLGHLETGDLGDGVTNELSADGREFTGSVVALHDALYSGAPVELRDAIAEGGVDGFGSDFFPLMPCSTSMIRAARREFNEQKSSVAVNEPRISRREFPITTANGTRTLYVFVIDETVLIPISEVSQYDKYLNGTSHFAYLTISGVIQLGASFAALPVVNESEVGIKMEVSDRNKDYGNHSFLAHALMAAGINDYNYITGDYIFGVEA